MFSQFMNVAVGGIRKGFTIFWGDSILLLLFNFLCFLSALPALLFYSVTGATVTVVTSTVNVLLFLPLAFSLFALYALLFDCRLHIGIRFKKFFIYIGRTWKQALVFGTINIIVILLTGWNLRFYGQFSEAWAGFLQLLFLSISLVWATIQLVMLPLYPRTAEPNYRTVLRNAIAITGHYLLPVIVLVILTAGLLLLTYRLQALGALFTFVLIGALAEGVVGEAISDDLEHPS